MPAIPVLRRQRQEGVQLEAGLGYIAMFCLKTNKIIE